MAKPTLPDGSQSLDPVPENPFKETNPRHRTWGDATKRAEETLLKLNSATLGSLSPEGNPTRMLEHESARFDVWAERGLYVVWSDQDLAAFDAWLLSYASALLHKAVGTYGDDNPWAESYLARLKVKLMARVDHWRALARQCRWHLEIYSARRRSGGGSGGESQEGIEREPTAASSGPARVEQEGQQSTGGCIFPGSVGRHWKKTHPQGFLAGGWVQRPNRVPALAGRQRKNGSDGPREL